VASAVGGIPELVEDGRSGLLVPPGDAAALAEAVTRLVRDPEQARRLGIAARAAVGTRHDPGRHLAAVLSAYRDAVARRADLTTP
jgi:glycosyltransferase involved in cell wall biosynthesis